LSLGIKPTGAAGSHRLQLHNKISWLLPCSLGFTAYSFQTQLCSVFIRSQKPKAHPQPLYVLACEATGCVSDFCWHTPTHISCRAKILHCATWDCILLQVAPACGTRSETLILRLFAFWRALLRDRNEKLQSRFVWTQPQALLLPRFPGHEKILSLYINAF